MTFRLLDAHVGWDPAGECTLVGLDDPDGLRLPRLGPVPGGPDRTALLPWFPDPRLAPARPAGWYLIGDGRVRRRDGCAERFTSIRTPAPGGLRKPVAVAAAGHWLAVADDGRVLIWWSEGAQLVGVATGHPAARLAITPAGEALAADPDGTRLHRYAPDGRPRRSWRTGLPGRIEGLRIGPDRRVRLLTEEGTGNNRAWRLWVAERIGAEPVATTPAALAAGLRASPLRTATADGFCLTRPETPDADAGTDCFDWTGRPREPAPAVPDRTLATTGLLTTAPIDSGLSRCRWHRIRIDADIPAGTTVAVSVAVTEQPAPGPGDWQDAPDGATDVLIDRQPGRFLYLRLRLESDGTATPVVRRIRLDFPRRSSAEQLPEVFRAEPGPNGPFLDRFLALFDATLEDVDRVVERYPALLDGSALDDGALPWLGGLLGLTFEPGWDTATRRALIAAAPGLFRRRGTAAALADVVRIVFGVTPVIEELAAERRWLRVGGAGARPTPGGPLGEAAARAVTPDGPLGVARLFGRAQSRMRVGGALQRTPLRSGGDPYTDPLREHAYRLRVSLPARAARPPDPDAVARLVRAQTPAHTVAEVHRGGQGWVVGARSVVGVDTALEPLPPAVLGSATSGAGAASGVVQLNRQSVLAARRGPNPGMTVGERATVGVTSVAW